MVEVVAVVVVAVVVVTLVAECSNQKSGAESVPLSVKIARATAARASTRLHVS